MYCGNCGSRLELNDKFCQNCGNRVENIAENTANSSASTLNNNNNDSSSNAPLVLGIIALVLFWVPVIGLTLGLLALILGLTNKKNGGNNVPIVLGIISIVITILSFILILLGLFSIYEYEYYDEDYNFPYL